MSNMMSFNQINQSQFGSQISPRIRELKRIKQIRYQKLEGFSTAENMGTNLNASVQNPLLQQSAMKDYSEDEPKSLLYNKQPSTQIQSKG